MINNIILEVIKFTQETLQNDGKYSSKKVMIQQAFLACLFGYLYTIYKTQTVNLDMFNAFLLAVFGTSLVSSGSNLIAKKIETNSTENTANNIINYDDKKEGS